MEILDYRMRSGLKSDKGEASLNKYAPYVGEYEYPGSGKPIKVAVQDGHLVVQLPSGSNVPLKDPDEKGNWFCTLTNNLYCKFKLDDEGKDYLQRIQANALRMSELIDDLLKLSRLGREKLTVALVDLSHLAYEVMENQRSHYPDRNIEFQLQFDGQVYGDPRLLRIAIDNLINNALKYTRNVEKPHIEFGKTQQDNETVYYISDNGTGFDMQYADKLFGVFQRLHGTDYEGTGIGLATVRRIIQRHEGRIWAEAEPGKGATFYFTLGNLNPALGE